MIRSVEDAEDVAQTIFVRLLKRQVPPDLERNPRGYLYRAAVNASFNLLRAKRRELLCEDAARAESAGDNATSGISAALDDQLRMAMAELNPKSGKLPIHGL